MDPISHAAGTLVETGDRYPILRGAERAYILGGVAVLTIVSRVTGKRFTYKVVKNWDERFADPPVWFVSLLTGPDNTRDYTYMGTIFGSSGAFRNTPKSKIDSTAPGFVAFAWLWRHVDRLPESVTVYHQGTCSRCSRPLTDPESIWVGLGPICRGKSS